MNDIRVFVNLRNITQCIMLQYIQMYWYLFLFHTSDMEKWNPFSYIQAAQKSSSIVFCQHCYPQSQHAVNLRRHYLPKTNDSERDIIR